MLDYIFILIVIIYYCISYHLLKNPRLLKFTDNSKKWDSSIVNTALNGKGVLNFAHRGGAREGLENTMESFYNGFKSGANIIELDVRVTKDNQVVVIHDGKLQRLCGVSSRVELLNYAELPAFKEVIDLHFSCIHQQMTNESKTPYIPLLDQVFQEFKGVIINIEIKKPTDQSIKLVNQLILKYNREHLTIWGCKDYQMSQRFRQINPNIKMFFSSQAVSHLLYRYIFGIRIKFHQSCIKKLSQNSQILFEINLLQKKGFLPFSKINEDALEIPIFNQPYQNWCMKQPMSLSKKMKLYVKFCLMKLLFSRFFADSLFTHLKERGILVIFWVLNAPDDYLKATLYKGCSGIITDSPSLLTFFLSQQNLYISQK